MMDCKYHYTIFTNGQDYWDYLLNDLKKLDIKMLFISGDEDGCFLGGTKKAAKAVDAKLKLIQHCGHVCTIEKADEFNQMAFKFLRAAA